MKLIGLAGRAGAGKDTVAGILSAHHDFARLAFAEPLKQMLMAGLRELGVSRELLSDAAAKERPIESLGKSPRQLMQTLGTEWGRQMINEDLWVLLAERALVQYRKFASGLVLTDVRYENEAHLVRRHGGSVWLIRRALPANVRALGAHSSEAGVQIVPEVDSLLLNDAGTEQLADEVRAALAGERIVARGVA